MDPHHLWSCPPPRSSVRSWCLFVLPARASARRRPALGGRHICSLWMAAGVSAGATAVVVGAYVRPEEEGGDDGGRSHRPEARILSRNGRGRTRERVDNIDGSSQRRRRADPHQCSPLLTSALCLDRRAPRVPGGACSAEIRTPRHTPPAPPTRCCDHGCAAARPSRLLMGATCPPYRHPIETSHIIVPSFDRSCRRTLCHRRRLGRRSVDAQACSRVVVCCGYG